MIFDYNFIYIENTWILFVGESNSLFLGIRFFFFCVWYWLVGVIVVVFVFSYLKTLIFLIF